MSHRLGSSAIVWLAQDRVSASGQGRAIRVPKLAGEAVFLAMARRASVAGSITLLLRTGATSTGPWTDVASAAGTAAVAKRLHVDSNILDEWALLSYAIADGGTYDVGGALQGDARYDIEAIVSGAGDIAGSSGSGGSGVADYSTADLSFGPAVYPPGSVAASTLNGPGSWVDLGAAPTTPSRFLSSWLTGANADDITVTLETADDDSGTGLAQVHAFVYPPSGSGLDSYIADAGEVKRWVRINSDGGANVTLEAAYASLLLYLPA